MNLEKLKGARNAMAQRASVLHGEVCFLNSTIDYLDDVITEFEQATEKPETNEDGGEDKKIITKINL